MNTSDSQYNIPPEEYESYNPADTSAQHAFRQLSGTIAPSGQSISIYCLNTAFQQHPQSRARYRKIEAMLGDVNQLGYVPVKLDNVPGVIFSSMSERRDLMGEFTTIWVTCVDPGGQARGAALVCLNGVINHIIATDIYVAEGDNRALYLVEEIARRVAGRQPTMLMANEVAEADLVERLPIPEDLNGLLDNVIIDQDTYESTPRMQGHQG